MVCFSSILYLFGLTTFSSAFQYFNFQHHITTRLVTPITCLWYVQFSLFFNFKIIKIFNFCHMSALCSWILILWLLFITHVSFLHIAAGTATAYKTSLVMSFANWYFLQLTFIFYLYCILTNNISWDLKTKFSPKILYPHTWIHYYTTHHLTGTSKGLLGCDTM